MSKRVFLAGILGLWVVGSAEAQTYTYAAGAASVSSPAELSIGAVLGLGELHGVWGFEGEYNVSVNRGDTAGIARHVLFARVLISPPVRGMGVQFRPFIDAGPLIAINPAGSDAQATGGWHVGGGGVFAPGRHVGVRATVEWLAPHGDAFRHSWRFGAGFVVPL
jgi:hypothetical protein